MYLPHPYKEPYKKGMSSCLFSVDRREAYWMEVVNPGHMARTRAFGLHPSRLPPCEFNSQQCHPKWPLNKIPLICKLGVAILGPWGLYQMRGHISAISMHLLSPVWFTRVLLIWSLTGEALLNPTPGFRFLILIVWDLLLSPCLAPENVLPFELGLGLVAKGRKLLTWGWRDWCSTSG